MTEDEELYEHIKNTHYCEKSDEFLTLGRMYADAQNKLAEYNENIKQETKLEKAFWQVYSAMISANTSAANGNVEFLAKASLKAVDAGLKALNGDL